MGILVSNTVVGMEGFASRRTAVRAPKGMAACTQACATAAGVEILQKGGNAADAAVAMAAALAVSEPTSTGLGGDAFFLYYDAATQSVKALNGSGRTPGNLDTSAVCAEHK